VSCFINNIVKFFFIRYGDLLLHIICSLDHQQWLNKNSDSIQMIFKQKIKPDWIYALHLITVTMHSKDVIKTVCPYVKGGGSWKITSPDSLKALAELLLWTQPHSLEIEICSDLTDVDEGNLRLAMCAIKAVGYSKKFSLNLKYSHEHFKELREDVLVELNNTR